MNTYRHHIRFTADKISRTLRDIGQCIYPVRVPLESLRIGPGEFSERDEDWQPIHAGDTWGGRNEWNWFKATVTIPETWAGQRVGLFFALGHPSWRVQPEALVYINGEYRQGVDGNHHEILLTERAAGGETYKVTLRAWCTMFDEDTTALYEQIFWAGDLVQIDVPTRHFYHSIEVALGTALALDPNRYEYSLILNALDAAFQRLDMRTLRSPEFYASIAGAQTTLDEQLAKVEGLPQSILATGHAHIDVLWRWREVNTREKSLHTFGTVARLMEQYPHYHFTQSQPQLYDYVKQDSPHLYEQIKTLVKQGRWEPTGGMWVEADCNIPSGESLVRQVLLGRKFFRDEFGIEDPILWLPDTFGYSWALPQIIKRSGMQYFMTSKISWNAYNRLPYDSFWWRGIDGTEVLTHFLTAPGDPRYGLTTYNAELTPAELIGTWDLYQQKGQHDELLSAFGYGDGGGGPTLEMLERAERSRNHPGLPRLEQGSAKGFFERLDKDGGNLPTWNGELYLELHRGTYTSQSRNKRSNRKAEVLFHRAELVAAIATLVGQAYPRERLNDGWKLILLNQFHDVIPGSSIREVYEDSTKHYAQIMAVGERVLTESVEAVAKELPLGPGEQGLLVWFATSVGSASEVATVPAEYLPEGMIPVDMMTGALCNIQRSEKHVHVDVGGHTGPMWHLFRLEQRTSELISLSEWARADVNTLENRYIRLELNELGEIVRLFDKRAKREVIPAGAVANQLQAFEDRPAKWDAWDIDITYEEKRWLAVPDSVSIIENGPLRATIEVRKNVLSSVITQRITLDYDSSRIDFHTSVDWHERHILLKVAFPVDLLSPRATFDVQFGNVERPTHHNTSWDWARFETVGHKWADLSETNYGVSLLNDCKYGYDVQDNVLRLSLLRAPTFPDPEADQGEQLFTYGLLPHMGGLGMSTIQEAHDLNDPPMIFQVQGQAAPTKRFAANQPLFWTSSLDSVEVLIDTVKAAEDGRGLILRLFETRRTRGCITLQSDFSIAHAWETNLMETDEQELEIKDGKAITLHFTPFQIRTIRLIPA